MILELCKGVHCVDLGESFQTHIYLQNLASIQPRTSPVKFARSSGAAARSIWKNATSAATAPSTANLACAVVVRAAATSSGATGSSQEKSRSEIGSLAILPDLAKLETSQTIQNVWKFLDYSLTSGNHLEFSAIPTNTVKIYPSNQMSVDLANICKHPENHKLFAK